MTSSLIGDRDERQRQSVHWVGFEGIDADQAVLEAAVAMRNDEKRSQTAAKMAGFWTPKVNGLAPPLLPGAVRRGIIALVEAVCRGQDKAPGDKPNPEE